MRVAAVTRLQMVSPNAGYSAEPQSSSGGHLGGPPRGLCALDLHFRTLWGQGKQEGVADKGSTQGSPAGGAVWTGGGSSSDSGDSSVGAAGRPCLSPDGEAQQSESARPWCRAGGWTGAVCCLMASFLVYSFPFFRLQLESWFSTSF